MIEVVTDRSTVVVGGTVRARVRWQHPGSPRALRVELRWVTEGRGDVDVGTVDRAEFSAAQGVIPPEVEVVLTVPQSGPASYDGQLIRVLWRVRASLDIPRRPDPDAEAELRVVPAIIPSS